MSSATAKQQAKAHGKQRPPDGEMKYSHRNITERQRLTTLQSQLDSEFSTFRPQYRDLNDYILPTRGRFWLGDGNRGDRRNLKILDSTGTRAARTLRSGMMSGVTSPAKRWFKLLLRDPDLNKFPSVQKYLFDVSEIMNSSFLRSNLYQTKPLVYGDLGTFGTAAYSVEKDYNSVLYTQSYPIGSYRIAKNNRGVVDTFFREFRMTIAQLVEEFGVEHNGQADWSMFSDFVKNEYYNGNYQTWVDVCYCVRPNDWYAPGMLHSKFRKYRATYYEKGSSATQQGQYLAPDANVYLRQEGYNYFPVLVPRWEVAGEDVYGTDCPGMTAIGDIKQLQTGEKLSLQGITANIKPPMTGPSQLKNQKTSVLPGDMTYTDEREGQKGFRPVYQVDPRVQEMEYKQEQVRGRVKSAYFEDLFLMMQNSDRRDITAREIDERHEEKLLALGPVMEQINQDDLDPFIDISFQIHLELGLLPPPPPELEGQDLGVEYISMMGQAQKMLGIGTLERFAQFSGQLVGIYKGAEKKMNAGKLIDAYGDALSMPPGIVRSEEEVASMEQQEQQAQQRMAQAEMMNQGAQAAQRLAGADMSGDNALTRLLEGAQSGGVVPTV